MQRIFRYIFKYFGGLFAIIFMLGVAMLPKAYAACCLDVTLSCSDDSCTGVDIPFNGTVFNCGQEEAFNVTVKDSNNNIVDFFTSIGAGQTENFSGFYTPGPTTLTVNVSAEGDTSCDRCTDSVCDSCGEKICEGCRMTGGGKSTAGLARDLISYDGSVAKGKSFETNGINIYTFGGQVGASTAQQPQPSGEWTHHQLRGEDGSFVFHAGTASAPVGTEIDLIQCSDEGWCDPARQAPFKQIDFEGVGTFKSIKKKSDSPVRDAGAVAGETFHWFEVHAEDLGEPGGKNGVVDGASCPDIGADGLGGFNADCGCADFYRITIYAPINNQSVGPDKTNVIYEVFGRLIGGNFQIHPPTGNDLN